MCDEAAVGKHVNASAVPEWLDRLPRFCLPRDDRLLVIQWSKPCTTPSARAKSCTYLRWFARPGKMPAEPYFELPISLSKLRRLMQFRLGSHDLPIEQGRMARPIVPRCLRRCTLCSRYAPGDERHFMLECPRFDDIRAQYLDLVQDARDSMRNLMWHQNQKALSDFVIAILDEPRT